jgi:DNA uptake protein ComE-like DNA-binding protein
VPESFTFDPNEADSTQLLRLGLASFQVRSIYRFRAKGGRFSTKDDFRRVYRLTNEQWEHLSPLIRIASKYRLVDVVPQADKRRSSHPASSIVDTIVHRTDPDSSATSRPKPVYVQKLSGDETIDINLADSALLCRVPGIGPYFARRIIQYRRRLGGFASAGQLLQIENFPADALAWIQVPDTCQVQKLQINRLSTRKLMKHPYMGYYRASEIADYRRVHGPIRSIEVLKSLPHFTEEDILRLAPYLSFE